MGLRRFKVWGLLMLIIGGVWCIGDLRAGDAALPLPRVDDHVVRAAMTAAYEADPFACFEHWHVSVDDIGNDEA